MTKASKKARIKAENATTDLKSKFQTRKITIYE
jgi:hypothetical protein